MQLLAQASLQACAAAVGLAASLTAFAPPVVVQVQSGPAAPARMASQWETPLPVGRAYSRYCMIYATMASDL